MWMCVCVDAIENGKRTLATWLRDAMQLFWISQFRMKLTFNINFHLPFATLLPNVCVNVRFLLWLKRRTNSIDYFFAHHSSHASHLASLLSFLRFQLTECERRNLNVCTKNMEIQVKHHTHTHPGKSKWKWF